MDWPPLRRSPLPRQVTPVHNETLDSFLHRLAAANHMSRHALVEYLGPHIRRASMPRTPGAFAARPRTDSAVTVLAQVTGIIPARLSWALPELATNATDRGQPRNVHTMRQAVLVASQRLACRRCMAAKNISIPVLVWMHRDQQVCIRHALWIGYGVTQVAEQVDLRDTPEIIRAGLRHHRLTTRFGRPAVEDCFDDAFHLVIRTRSRLRRDRLNHFFAREHLTALPTAYNYAAGYPEMIGLLTVLAAPRWQTAAGSGQAEQENLFLAEVARHWPDAPANVRVRDPLARWMSRQRQRFAEPYRQVSPLFPAPDYLRPEDSYADEHPWSEKSNLARAAAELAAKLDRTPPGTPASDTLDR
jgi:hypothetical protein